MASCLASIWAKVPGDPWIKTEKRKRHKTVHVLLGIAALSALQAASRIARDDGFCSSAADIEHHYAAVVFAIVMTMVAYGTNIHVDMFTIGIQDSPSVQNVQKTRNLFTFIGILCHILAVIFTGVLWNAVHEADTNGTCDMLRGDAHQAAWVVIVTLAVSFLIVVADVINSYEKPPKGVSEEYYVYPNKGDILLFTVFLWVVMYVIAESEASTTGKVNGVLEVFVYVIPGLYLVVTTLIHVSKNSKYLQKVAPQRYKSNKVEWVPYVFVVPFLLWSLGATWNALNEDLSAMPNATEAAGTNYSGCIPNSTDYEDIMGLGLTVPGYLVFHIALITYTLHAYLRNGLLLASGATMNGTNIKVLFYRDCLSDFNIPLVTLIVLGLSSVMVTGVTGVTAKNSDTIVGRLHIPNETLLINGTNTTNDDYTTCSNMNEHLQQASTSLFWMFIVMSVHALALGIFPSGLISASKDNFLPDRKVQPGYSVSKNAQFSSDSERMLRPTTRLNQHQTSTSDLSF